MYMYMHMHMHIQLYMYLYFGNAQCPQGTVYYCKT